MLQNLINALSLGGLYAIMALGVALVFGVMRLMNFAYGELIMIGGYLLLGLNDLPWYAYVIFSIAGVCTAALLMERVAFRPFRSADTTTLLVTSFALSMGLQGLAIILLGARPRSVNVLPSLSNSLTVFGDRVAWLDVVTIAATLALLAAFTLFLRRTLLGAQVRAASEDFRMARVLGVRANRVIAATFGASGIFAGVAAILLVAQTGTLSPSMGFTPVLIAFVAAVIGGLGSLYGAALGGAILGFLTVALQAWLPVGAQSYRDAIIYGAVIVILLVRPGGLVGTDALRERV